MESIELFSILDSVDSTNNYAMGKLHAGLAKHGMAWFAKEQTAGKGQRGKDWLSNPGENIALSVIIEPAKVFHSQPFLFNAIIANACFDFLYEYIKKDLKIKWPNDMYAGDRKAGGILIENIYHGIAWKWAVVGIGINVNQIDFLPEIKNPVSIKQITGIHYETTLLAGKLHQQILNKVQQAEDVTAAEIIKIYNNNLYMFGRKAKLKKQNIIFETTISGVNGFGQLLTSDSIPRQFDFGEVEWIL